MNTEPSTTSRRELLRRSVMELPGRVLRFLRHNWPWKLLSIFLAVCLWAGLISQDPALTRERVFTDVPLAVNGADSLRRNNGLIVVSGLESENLNVRLRVDVPQREYSTVTSSNYNPRVDLTRISEPGEQTVRVLTTSTSVYGVVQSVVPDTLNIVVDEYVTNYRVPVAVNVIGDYPDGFYGSALSLNPSIVTLSGPKSLVDQVARICVDFDVSRLSPRAGQVRMARALRFEDAEGNAIESSLLEVTSADVVLRTIIVEQTLYPTRTIAMDDLLLTTGSPAKGYRVKNVTVSPTSVQIAGTEACLAINDSLFVSSAVDVSGAKQSFTQEVRVHRPNGLVHLSSDTVTVKVEIEPVILSRTFDSVKVTARGLADDQKATLETRYVSIVVTGPQLEVNALRTAKLNAYVNAADLEAGEYELPVEVYLEETDASSFSFDISPATVDVTITQK